MSNQIRDLVCLTVYGQLTERATIRLGRDLKEDTDLQNAGIDSLQIVQLAVEIEDTFGITLDADSYMGWKTIGDIIKTVKRVKA